MTEQNIGAIAEAVEKDLKHNLSSGFCLPIACQHSRYELKDLQHAQLPDPTAYISLLAGMLTKHPHFDALFAPLSDLNAIVASGGWNERLHIPSRLEMIVGRDGVVRIFRQVPMLAKPWKNAADIFSADPDSLHDDLISFCAQELTPEAHQPCADCSLRFMCGGMDLLGNDPVADDLANVSDLICSTRQFFLEAFLWQRIKIEEVTAQEPVEVEAAR